jgi:hypothetical protein
MSSMGETRASAPPLHGEHNHAVYCGILGLTEAEVEDLRKEGAV